MRLAVLNGRVIDPANNVDQVKNLYIVNDKIEDIHSAEQASFVADITIDATNYVVSPGLVDLNAHLLSNPVRQAALQVSLSNAIIAGITHVGINAFTSEYCLNPIEIAALSQPLPRKAKAFFIGALTKGLKGTRLNELKLLQESGCVGVSNDSYPIANTLIKRRCYDYATMLGLKLFIHPEDPDLFQVGGMHEGNISTKLGIFGIPTLCETLALSNELLLAADTSAKMHIARLSSKEGLELFKHGKNYLPITSDVAIHQLYFTDQDIQIDNGLCHVRPPFRTEADLKALRTGVKEGLIDVITSDHIALSKEGTEVPFQDSKPGIASWPVLLPLSCQLAEEEKIPLSTIIASLTSKPAAVLGINAGHLSVGSLANVVIFDPNEVWALASNELMLFGSNNPFAGKKLRGRVKYTILDGKVAYGIS